MLDLARLEGKNAQELWKDKEIKANLKPFINKKHAIIDSDTGTICTGSSKRILFSKLIHNWKMKKTESKYFEKKVNAAVQEYKKQVEEINRKALATLIQPIDIQSKIEAEQRKIDEADAKIAQQLNAKRNFEAPIKEAEAKKADLLFALNIFGISEETITHISLLNNKIQALNDDIANLDQETHDLNLDNKERADKYPLSVWGLKGVNWFNQDNDLDASIDKINKDDNCTPDEKIAITVDVLAVINNNHRLLEIPVERKELSDRRKDTLAKHASLMKGVLAIITEPTFAKVFNQIDALERKIANKTEEMMNSAAFAAIENQIQAANAIKEQAQAEISRYNPEV